MSKGCRALTDEELEKIKAYFDNRIGDVETDKWDTELRNKTIFLLQCNLGFRISELLSLNVGDVVNERGVVLSEVYLRKKNTKGKVSGRRGILNDKIREVLKEYINHYYTDKGLELNRDLPLFISRKGTRLSSRQCMYVYRDCFQELELDLGITGTHTARKSFAQRIYKAVGKNITSLQLAMGHKSISSTTNYIAYDNEEVNNALANLEI